MSRTKLWDCPPHAIHRLSREDSLQYITNDEIDAKNIKHFIFDNDIERALELCNKILDKDTQNFYANFYKGIILLDEQEFEEAAGFFKKAIEAEPSDHASHLSLGICYGSSASLATDDRERSDNLAKEAITEFATAKDLKNKDNDLTLAEERYKFAVDFLMQEGFLGLSSEQGPFSLAISYEISFVYKVEDNDNSSLDDFAEDRYNFEKSIASKLSGHNSVTQSHIDF